MLVPGQKVAVLGAGNMGSGIAQSLATAGFRVVVRDLTEKELDRGKGIIAENLARSLKRGKITEEKRAKILGNIEFTTDLAKASDGAKVVIEAVFEEEKVKLAVFSDLAKRVSEETIVATNTSSLSVAKLFETFPNHRRTAGLHFFYPASVNKLVEIIAGPETSRETLQTLTSLVFSLKKIPISTRDSAGFCVNRFFVPLLNEATRIVEEGIANIPDVEAAANELFGTKMGPFASMNATGVPIAYHATSSLGKAFGRFYVPSRLLAQQFEKGEKWGLDGSADPTKKEAVRNRLLGLVCGIAAQLVSEGVTTSEETDRGAVTGLAWKQGPFALMNAIGVPFVLEQVEALHLRWAQDFPVSPRLGEAGITGDPWPLCTVRTEKEGPLAWVLLDRPEVMNALNSKVLEDLDRAITEVTSDPQVRVILLGSTSNVFAAGADIEEMVAKTVAEAAAFTANGHRVLHRIQSTAVPTIAVVDGYAFGGGLEIALSADLILASETATLGLPEVSLGIIPGFGGTQRLSRRVGVARAKMMILGGLQIKAREAYEMGLVSRLYPPEKLRDEAKALALTMASRAPVAVRVAKEAIEVGSDGTLEGGLALERQLATYTFTTEDLREGMRAFLEKRPAQFQGK
jgi:enoyl-CoA hydratase/3-hydroxyacyl-CoA dehydrogenase